MLRLAIVFCIWIASTAHSVPGLTDTNVRTILSADECPGADPQ
jgi:hypothetical protein